MKTLYFDCFAGASGNMILGGLISLGVKSEILVDEIAKLNISDFDIEFAKVNRSGINSVHAKTIYKEEKTHRHFSDIKQIIKNSDLSERVKSNAIEIFKDLAKAEAKVHGIDIEKVHFHEVGAMDAIIDVVGACIGFEILEIEKFVCSKIHVGSGFIQIAHGKYPVPPPAVAELLKDIPIYSTEIEGELITPTGAAIISTLCDEFGEINDFQTKKIGYGAGTRKYENFPNVLRLMIGESEPKRRENTENYSSNDIDLQLPTTDYLLILETNLDDCSPEVLGFVMENAFEIGALDCWFTPIQMKKNRPATKISILCKIGDKEKIAELLYTETSTLGIRIQKIERECLEREIQEVETEFGMVEMKVAKFKDKIVNIKPEYDQIRKIAFDLNSPFKEIEEQILEAYKNNQGDK